MTINELFIILTLKQPSKFLMSKEEDLFKLIPELKYCKGFDQKNEWHPYDVYTHILKVVDGVDCNLPTRLAALFHDIGKPQTFKLDANGVGHFYGHWEVSKNIFRDFAIKHEEIGDNLKELVEQLIEFHDKDFGKLNDEGLKQFVNDFSEEEMFMLYDLKEADLKAQNEKFHGKLDEYNRQKVRFFTYYDEAKKVIKTMASFGLKQ